MNTKEIKKEIVKEVRELEKDFGKFKLSITTSYNTISISLMEAKFDVFINEEELKKLIESKPIGLLRKKCLIERLKKASEDGNSQLNPYYLDEEEILSNKCKELLLAIRKIESKYHYDNSDAMRDYFDTNYYPEYAIGKWNKPFKKNSY